MSKTPETDNGLPEQFLGHKPPLSLNKNRKIAGVLHLAGKGAKDAPVMFIASSVLDEETADRNSPPTVLKGPAGNIFRRILNKAGFKPEDWYYTALNKYSLPRNYKLKPKAPDIRWNIPALHNEIHRVKPQIIVCLGKVPLFDMLVGFKATPKDVQGGFFRSKEYGCLVYLMDNITLPLFKPEFFNKFLIDLREIRRTLDIVHGIERPTIEQTYITIKTPLELDTWTRWLMAKNPHTLSVDCEWEGQTHIDGSLRSIQVCWEPGQAAYIMFLDQDSNEIIPIDEAASILDPLMNDPKVGFIGHNIVADFMWMEYHLNIDTYGRARFDTMFARFVLDEYSDLKLERLSVELTDLGRYDMDLYMWKRKHKLKKSEGYKGIPDDIIIPYAIKDVDVVMRAYPILLQRLMEQGLYDYFLGEVSQNLRFVTDGFGAMVKTGLPIDVPYLDELRDVYTRNHGLLLDQFRIEMSEEALYLFRDMFADFREETPESIELARQTENTVLECRALAYDTDDAPVKRTLYVRAHDAIKAFAGQENYEAVSAFFNHYWEAREFNLNSQNHKTRWLFEVRGFIPVKSTKRDGISLPWETVETFDKDKRKDFSPAADVETLRILQERDTSDRFMVAKMLEINSVGNILKMFLRQPSPDGTERGLHKWVCSDGRIHCNFAATETNRPRSWNPNILNLPKAVSKQLEAAFSRLDQTMPSTVRSIVTAPEGWCLVDSDLDTAEVISLAYLSNDEDMIGACTAFDEKFILVDPVIARANGVEPFGFKGNYMFRITDEPIDGLTTYTMDNIPEWAYVDGKILRPKRDLHWELAELAFTNHRERMDEDRDRGAGKVGNFAIPYGASPPLLERQVEVITGIKPAAGTGENLIEGYNKAYPVAAYFLQNQEEIVLNPGYYRAISGRVRHFWVNELTRTEGLSEYMRNAILNPMTRESRNFPMQNLVADTTARACLWMTDKFRERKMRSSVMALLYDAVTVLSPLEERHEVAALKKQCFEEVGWEIHGRKFRYTIDTAFTYRWGVKPSKEQKQQLEDTQWKT